MRPTDPASTHDAPAHDETTLLDLVVTGVLPPALSGRYVRTGPNPIGATRASTGATPEGMLHAVTLQDGRAVSYRSRWVNTDAASRMLGTERALGVPPTSPGSSTNLVVFGATLLSLDDGALAYEIGADLETVRRVDLAGSNRGVGAHPKTDPVTGELHVLSSPGTPDSALHLLSPGGLTRRSRSAQGAPGPVRDVGFTQTHLAFFGDGLVGVASRADDRRIEWCAGDVAERARPINAHDDRGAVIALMVGAGIELWTAEPSSGQLWRDVVDPTPHRFARINEERNGMATRYVYCVPGPTPAGSSIQKLDLVERSVEWHHVGHDRHPGEFLFVADPERPGREDGGWLMGLVHGATATDLVVLDAANLTGPVVATVHIPRRIPQGSHGVWAPEGGRGGGPHTYPRGV
jgi:carotenoid cleavage dioxygenase-like enzyme